LFLTNQQLDNLSDLILDKTQYFFEKSKMHEWPPAETIKIQNLHRLSLFVYNHLKLKNVVENLGANAEIINKSFLSIAGFFETIFENNNFSFFSDEFTFTLFQDFFHIYLKFINLKEKGLDSQGDANTQESITDTINTTLEILDEEISNIK